MEQFSLEQVKKTGEELKEAFWNTCQWKSNYELLTLNINDNETPQRKYKQCLDEMFRRVTEISRLEINLEEQVDKIAKAEQQKLQTSDEFKLRKLERKIKLASLAKYEVELAIEGQLREFTALYGYYQQSEKFSAKEIQEAEPEYHRRKKLGMAQRQLETGHPIDPELIRVLTDMGYIENNHADNFEKWLASSQLERLASAQESTIKRIDRSDLKCINE